MKPTKTISFRIDIRVFPDGRREAYILEPDTGKPQYFARLRKWRASIRHHTREPLTSQTIAWLLKYVMLRVEQ